VRYSVSDTAEHGDYTGGPRVVTDATRAEMRRMLAEIRDGRYARKWVAENEAGRPWFNAQRQTEQEQLLEQVGGRLRALMPFLDPVTLRPDGSAAPAAPAEPTAVAVSAQEVSR
jgi:ketol-acid reductoisomerase